MPTQVAIIKKNYAGTARIFQGLAAIVLIAAGIWGYLQYQKLAEVYAAHDKGKAQLSQLQSAADETANAFGELKKQSDAKSAEIANKIQGIYPTNDNYTGLTKMMDDFFTENDKPTNRIFQNSLSFSPPIADSGKEYAVLPFTMSILASRDNFEKFLRFIDTSGDLEGNVRLMDIQSISLTLPQESEELEGQPAADEDLTVSLSMNAYFQKPAAGAIPAAQ